MARSVLEQGLWLAERGPAKRPKMLEWLTAQGISPAGISTAHPYSLRLQSSFALCQSPPFTIQAGIFGVSSQLQLQAPFWGCSQGLIPVAAPAIQQGFQVFLAGLWAPFQLVAERLTFDGLEPGQHPDHDCLEGVLPGPLPSSCPGQPLVGLRRWGEVDGGHG
jgi:hypothetical protein